ncbi:Imidazolonepropionase [Halogranum gelatinilyticum]|uniref:Imidazolonepropionase n=1 Tax=Halogranum gelatinilyticum TaxID=660521 RepID=A0A1G9SIX0_9EURY|nr:amidohydrolase family protein [Halogranum gelatinilyticum]SDM35444.1 Imidazolonepropionase [Halogranum gelatinilyticum]
MHVLRGGHVVDVDGVREVDVAVDDGRIVAVGDDVEEGDEETDVSGQFVAPGLVDAHVHLGMDGRPDVSTVQGESEATAAYRVAANLRDALDAGVTTVRDLGARDSLALDAARAVETGVLDGPRILAAGQNVVMTGGHGHWFGREADGAVEVRKAAREQLKRGADVVKCMATGGVLTEGAETGLPELTAEELTALVDAASGKAVPTAAHAHGKDGIDNAVRAGISSIEHGTFMDRETAELMAEQGTYWVPTTAALVGIVENGVEAGIPESAVRKADEAIDAHADAFAHALDAGVSIAMGTDAGTPFNFFADIPQEMELLVDRGLTPEHALRAATVEAADLLGVDDLGKVAEGYHADLVVLDADPTEDASAWREPAAVVAAGERVR